ncbi:hypothetical protein NBRC111893_921 [Lentilactobacillus kosonis]|uniref:Uncharacterized protein n=1 Tax=Lentilactobacillus kosonis TaxID=2810561 RepID=A0A401FK59_9LACO|nr:hypothetical protein NBRC111893_921 [Lentilactobacillus kosonis]
MKNIYLVLGITITGLLVAVIVTISIIFYGNPTKMVLFLIISVIIYQLIFTPVVILYLRNKTPK